ncbi:MAG: tetratricopeptide repeat protein [Pirellulales bacterium]
MATLPENSPNLPSPGQSLASTGPKPLTMVWILIGLGILAYWNSLSVPFLLDDILWIRDNRQIDKLWPPLDWRRPFGFWTFQLQHALHGTSIVMLHVVNLAIHITNGVLLAAIASRLLALQTLSIPLQKHARQVALAIAAIWLVHPLATAGVTYTVQRLESLMALFYLLGIFSLLKSQESKNPMPWKVLLFLSFLLGIGTKENIATLPFVLCLIDWAFLTRSLSTTLKTRGLFYASLFLPLVWMAWVLRGTAQANDYYQAGFGYDGYSPLAYLKTQASVLVHYLRLAFWPDRLVFDYAWPIETNPLKIYLPGLVVLALLALSLWALVRRPTIGVLALSFFLILAPTSSFMPINDIAAEHRMYLPLMIVVGLVVAVVAHLLFVSSPDTSPTASARWAFIALVLMLTLRTVLRNHDYSSPMRLWRTVIAAAPHNGRAHTTLSLLLSAEAEHLEKQGDPAKAALREEEALAELDEAMKVAPHYYQAFQRRADIYAKSQQYEKALALYDQAISIHPTYLRAWHHRAMTLVGLTRYDDAIASLQEVDRLQKQQRNNYLDVEKMIAQIEQIRTKKAAEATSKVSSATASPPSAEAAAK